MLASDHKDKFRHEWEVLEKEEKALAQEKKKLSDEWVLIEKYQQIYEKDRATFEGIVRDKFVFLPDDEIVHLNIGGKLFKSTVKVWTRDRFSILAHLCTVSPKLARDARGHFFFDRDWSIFKYIYAFLRDKTLPDALDVLRDLYYEASFYRITLLRHAIEAFLKNHHASDVDRVHQGYVTADEIYRQPNVHPRAAGEREWARVDPAIGPGAATDAKGLTRRPSLVKVGRIDAEIRPAPPRVHPFHHEATTTCLDMHIASPHHHPESVYRRGRGFDPALDFIERRGRGGYADEANYNHHHGGGYDDYDPNFDRRPASYDYDRYHDDDRRGRYYDRHDHREAYLDERARYEGQSKHMMHNHHRPAPIDVGDFDDRHHYGRDHLHGPLMSSILRHQPPMSPPLADPHGFLSRRKQHSMGNLSHH
ncbi:Aste57867_10860 [Aphanomyces stellatus]|uniref:Aste57867_10860 protein n=1 Tax=Aphanomyces stellatus TaxID=120398 RepID=A0A485KSL5_9STRA|nr:hypothetical protein As57867_010820 [Aphanomyces stellatus]VFT87728.1 Aste57867_10860 [Aphanomyces stellatus]